MTFHICFLLLDWKFMLRNAGEGSQFAAAVKDPGQMYMHIRVLLDFSVLFCVFVCSAWNGKPFSINYIFRKQQSNSSWGMRINPHPHPPPTPTLANVNQRRRQTWDAPEQDSRCNLEFLPLEKSHHNILLHIKTFWIIFVSRILFYFLKRKVTDSLTPILDIRNRLVSFLKICLLARSQDQHKHHSPSIVKFQVLVALIQKMFPINPSPYINTLFNHSQGHRALLGCPGTSCSLSLSPAGRK